MNTPAGWYPQPDGRQRYCDGEQWTEHFAPGVLPATAPAASTSRQKASLIAWIAALAMFFLLTGSAAAKWGAGGVLIVLSLAALVAGVLATVRGRLTTLRLASRRAGLLMAVSGLVVTMVGTATSPTGPTTEATGGVTDVSAAPSTAHPTSADTTPPTPTDAPSPVIVPVVPVRPTTAPAATRREPPAAGTALAAAARLTVRGRAPKTGYSRDQFGRSWYDSDRNGCDTRNDILRRDLRSKDMKNVCKVLAGTLATDPYTRRSIRFVLGGPSEVDIDHVVALSDAWQKGAASWPAGRRLAFANDPLNLLAVDASANRSKGDGDTATWLPANKSYRCTYVARQVAVKGKYGVWVTSAERDAMTRVLTTCPSMRLPGPGSAPSMAVPHPSTSTYKTPPVAPVPPAALPAKEYANCTAMHVDYKGGVAIPGAVDRRASGRAKHTPVYSESLYNANTGSDRDEDHIACEV